MTRLFTLLLTLLLAACASPKLRGTGDLGVVIERASGQVTLVEDQLTPTLCACCWPG